MANVNALYKSVQVTYSIMFILGVVSLNLKSAKKKLVKRASGFKAVVLNIYLLHNMQLEFGNKTV